MTKNRKKLLSAALILCMLSTFMTAFAADYTYTVSIFAGARGHFRSDGIHVENSTCKVERHEQMIRVTGLKPGAVISFDIDAVALNQKDGKYYVRGIRESGRDNDTVSASAIVLRGENVRDLDYVAAYGIKTDEARYTVRYRDEQGKDLAESRTYYGNVGDKPVISYLYIEGYQPQAYNLTRTLSADASRNEFIFIYRKIPTGNNGNNNRNNGNSNTGNGGNTGINTGGTSGTTNVIRAPGSTTNGQAAEADADGNQTADTAENTAAEQNEQPQAADNANIPQSAADLGENGQALLNNTDQPQELLDLDDEDTPLAAFADDENADTAETAQQTQKQHHPLLTAGIVLIILIALGAAGFIVIRKRRNEGEDENEEENE